MFVFVYICVYVVLSLKIGWEKVKILLVLNIVKDKVNMVIIVLI